MYFTLKENPKPLLSGRGKIAVLNDVAKRNFVVKVNKIYVYWG